MSEVKAYRVAEDYDGHALIVFAKHRATAQSDGANELNREFTEVKCHRATEYDQYVEKGYVPVSILLNDGWWQYCLCGEQVNKDSFDYGASIVDEDVYCSQDCLEKKTKQRSKR